MTPPAEPAFYVDPAALAAAVRRMRRDDQVDDELGLMLLKIAGGVWDKWRFTDDRDEFAQACFLHFLGAPLAGADPRKNLFSYLTTCAIRFGSKQRNRAAADRRRFREYVEDLRRAGTIPTE